MCNFSNSFLPASSSIQKFGAYADEIVNLSQENVKKVFGVLEGLSVATTSHALHSNETFPFVTIPNYEERAAAARASSQALLIAYLPLVQDADRNDWESYSVENQDWIQSSYQTGTEIQPISEQIFTYVKDEKMRDRRQRHLADGGCDGAGRRLKEKIPDETGTGPYAPVWMISPTVPANDTSTINYNLFDKPVYEKAISFLQYSRKPVFLDVCNQAAWFGEYFSSKSVLQTVIVQPIFESFEVDAPIVGTFVAIIPWGSFFENIIESNAEEVTVVLSNTCDEVFSFSVQGHTATFLEEEDLQDPSYNYLGVHTPFAEFANPPVLFADEEHCIYTLHVYPTKELEAVHMSQQPLYFCLAVLAVFAFTSFIFIVYDYSVQQRQMKLLRESAAKNEELVGSLFPSQVRDRLFNAQQARAQLGSADMRLSSKDSVDVNQLFGSDAIADLFPSVSVVFIGIAGFYKWASVRQPDQVFKLLENVYHAFDVSADRGKVFKVESIGDSYVAACGLPDPCENHAVVISKFARTCLASFSRVVRRLANELGPGTSQLKMKCGISSGTCTAGVLRGSKARYQIFGNTVLTASQLEGSCPPGKILLANETAQLLQKAGKDAFVEPNDEKAGPLETWFLKSRAARYANVETSSVASASENLDLDSSMVDRREREALTNWVCSLLLPHLKAIKARRSVMKPQVSPAERLKALEKRLRQKYTVLEEVKEVIDLPVRNGDMPDYETSSSPELSRKVVDQLKTYITLVASLYEPNSFHQWAHACHVTSSMSKSLSRIVQPGRFATSEAENAHLRYTYGISDPLTIFALLLSSVIHDVDHKGVGNNVLAQEDPGLAMCYNEKSVAEQNSVDLAWNALMSDEFQILRNAIYCNEEELLRLRALMVNAVMATDIFDADLAALRKRRWAKVFDEQADKKDEDLSNEDINRKATLVIEHLIQASDVAHTMQHCDVYLEWNARLFEEMYVAYITGRTDKDPSSFWFQGELGFFDNYVIPLAKKLEQCGVFGVSSHEYLQYAMVNRREWETRGQQLVADMVARVSASLQEEPQQIKDGHQSSASIIYDHPSAASVFVDDDQMSFTSIVSV